ncbi:SDR family NAD(P)-dependent oxidoreductase [Ligilactobacillus sp. LYQ60]|uniref:SDR family NAD(P)-dependent oxidoreductase n=1 Tax=unclassified Ligilactobacillus TaxID=2767920 RepID=UPI0038539F0D
MNHLCHSQRIAGRVVLIMGASSGLGEQLAYAFASEHARIVVCARRKEQLARVARKCAQISGQPATLYLIDVTDSCEVEQTIATIERQVGPIEIGINCAGVGKMMPAVEMSSEITTQMFRVNTLGTIIASREMARLMVTRHSGTIVNVASSAGKIATPKAAVYAATKAAVIAYSNALRLELRQTGVHVLTINPGPMRTSFFAHAGVASDYLDQLGPLALVPEKVAGQVVRAVLTGKRELNTPWIFEAAHRVYDWVPRIADRLTATVFNKK